VDLESLDLNNGELFCLGRVLIRPWILAVCCWICHLPPKSPDAGELVFSSPQIKCEGGQGTFQNTFYTLE
jgi:hypothetical protein